MGRVYFITNTGIAQSADVSSSGFTNNTWTHIVATFNSTARRIYMNSLLNASGGAVALNRSSQNFGMGIIDNGGGNFNGSIDEVLIFNRTLSLAEVKALYNASANKYFNNFTNLAQGAYNFTAYAVDTAANKNQTEQRTVTIDTTAPVSNLQAPANGSTVTTATHSFNATFSDNLNLANATFYLWNSTLTLINTTTNVLSGTTGALILLWFCLLMAVCLLGTILLWTTRLIQRLMLQTLHSHIIQTARPLALQ